MDTSEEEPTKNLEDPDSLNFERRLWETLHELNLKRSLLDDCRRDLNNAILVQHELERSLDQERNEVQETRVQLELTITAARRWEEERTSVVETATRQRVQLEVALKERDALRDQARAVQLENVKLTQTIEEQESQLRCQITFQESTMSYQNKVKEAMKEVHSQMQKLEQEQQHLEHTVEAVKTLSSRLQLRAQYHDSVQEKWHQQRESLEKMVVVLRAELDKIKMSPTIPTICQGHGGGDGPLYNAESQLADMRVRLAAECENGLRLSQALKGALRAMSQAQDHEMAMQETLNGVTTELEKERKCTHALQTSNDNLQEQLKSTQQELMAEKDQHKKTHCVECEVQTESITEANFVTESIPITYNGVEISDLESDKVLDLPPPDQYKDEQVTQIQNGY